MEKRNSDSVSSQKRNSNSGITSYITGFFRKKRVSKSSDASPRASGAEYQPDWKELHQRAVASSKNQMLSLSDYPPEVSDAFTRAIEIECENLNCYQTYFDTVDSRLENYLIEILQDDDPTLYRDDCKILILEEVKKHIESRYSQDYSQKEIDSLYAHKRSEFIISKIFENPDNLDQVFSEIALIGPENLSISSLYNRIIFHTSNNIEIKPNTLRNAIRILNNITDEMISRHQSLQENGEPINISYINQCNDIIALINSIIDYNHIFDGRIPKTEKKKVIDLAIGIKEKLADNIDSINTANPYFRNINTKISDASYSHYLGTDGNLTSFYGLKKVEYKAACLLTKNPPDLSEGESLFLSEFLKRSIGNMEINNSVRNALKSVDSQNPQNAYFIQALKIISRLSFKTKDLDQLITNSKKCKVAWEKRKNGQTLSKNEKLSLTQLSSLNDLSGLKMFLPFIPYGKNRELTQLHKEITEASRILTEIEEEFQTSNTYTSRDIHMILKSKLDEFGNKQTSFTGWIQKTFITQREHVSKIFKSRDEHGNIRTYQSHITGEHNINSFAFTDAIVGDVYRIDASKLLGKEDYALLRDIYGSDEAVSAHINQLYERIEENLHLYIATMQDKPRFPYEEGEFEERKKEIVKSVIGIGGKSRERLNFDQMRDNLKYLAGWNKEKMICSEFASYATIVALSELNRQLFHSSRGDKANTLQYGVSENFYNVLYRRYKAGEITKAKYDELWQKLKHRAKVRKPLINMPFTKDMQLETIYADKLIRILNDAGCLEKVKTPQIIQDLLI